MAINKKQGRYNSGENDMTRIPGRLNFSEGAEKIDFSAMLNTWKAEEAVQAAPKPAKRTDLALARADHYTANYNNRNTCR